MESINIITDLSSIGIFIAGLVLLVIATSIANVRVKSLFDANDELAEKNNLALALRRAGLLIGMAIPIGSNIAINSFEIEKIFSSLFDAILILVLMFISLVITDKLLLSNVDNNKEIKAQNLSVGILEFGILIGTGLIMQGSFSGDGVWYSSLAFFILGQFFMIFTVGIYSKNILKVKEDLGKNVSVSILLASYTIGLAFILKASLYGDFTNWENDLISFIVWAIIGTLLLAIFTTTFINKIFLPTTNIRQEIKDENIAGMLYIGAIKIAVAVLIANIIII